MSGNSAQPPTLEDLVTMNTALAALSILTDQPKQEAPTSRNGNRLVLHVTCQVHKGSEGFTNLVVTKHHKTIALNPHADNSCILTLDEATATVLHDTLGEWLQQFSRTH